MRALATAPDATGLIALASFVPAAAPTGHVVPPLPGPASTDGADHVGVRAVLSSPAVYDAFQWLMGGHVGRTDFARTMVRAAPGLRACSTSAAAPGTCSTTCRPACTITAGTSARRTSPPRARALAAGGSSACGLLTEAEVAAEPPYDVVIASGVLHHLDDGEVRALARLARLAVRAGGRFVSIDPVMTTRPDTRSRASWSRATAASTCARPRPTSRWSGRRSTTLTGMVRHRRWVPYTHWMMEATWRPAAARRSDAGADQRRS